MVRAAFFKPEARLPFPLIPSEKLSIENPLDIQNVLVYYLR